MAQPACGGRHLVWYFPAVTHHKLHASWLIYRSLSCAVRPSLWVDEGKCRTQVTGRQGEVSDPSKRSVRMTVVMINQDLHSAAEKRVLTEVQQTNQKTWTYVLIGRTYKRPQGREPKLGKRVRHHTNHTNFHTLSVYVCRKMREQVCLTHKHTSLATKKWFAFDTSCDLNILFPI